MLRGARRLHLDLHARHVDAGRAFAPAGLAGDAELQRLRHLVGGERVRPELAGDREPQRVGAAARHVALVAGDAIARAHHAAGELAAGAVVVAHLDRALETAAGARIGRPVELRLHRLARDSPGRSGNCSRSSNFGARTILPGLNRPFGSKRSFTSSKARTSRLPNIELVEFRAHDAVAVLAGMRALVVAHHRERLLGDGAHRLDVLLQPQVEHRAHMQAADRGVRVPGAARAVLLEHLGEPRGVVGEMLERHRAVLDEGDRLSLLLHRHHDVEAGGAHLGDRGLQLRDRAPRPRRPTSRRCLSQAKPRSPISSCEPLQPAHVLVRRPRRTRPAASPPARRARTPPASGGTWRCRAASSIMVRSTSSTAIGSSLTMCCAAVHRLVEAAEVAGADRAPAEQRRELQFDRGGEGERALRADQDVREIDVVACPAPARRDCSRRRGAAPWESAPRSRRPRARRARAGRARADAAANSPAGRRGRPPPARNAPCVPSASRRRSRARCRAWCRSAASARRRNCCRSCRRWWRARRSRHRPETTGRAA